MKVYLTLLLSIFCLIACGGSSDSSGNGSSGEKPANDFLYKSNLTPEQQSVKDELQEAEKKLQECAKRNPPVCDTEVDNYDKIANKACKMGVFAYECEVAQ